MGYKILLAEDSKTQSAYIRMVLESAGYTVVSADDGQQAKVILENFVPDLIVSDIVMPYVNGYELCQHVKSDPRLRGVYFVCLTALDSAQDVLRGLQAGANNFIRKPFKEDYLLTRIARILDNFTDNEQKRIEKPLEIDFGGHKIALDSNNIHASQIIELLLSMVEDVERSNNDFTNISPQIVEDNSKDNYDF